jgi:hypothetical protein
LLEDLREEEIPKVVWAVIRNNHPVGYDQYIQVIMEGGEARLGSRF